MRDLSLTVEPGDIYGFIGHNGAGKTTLIRSIVGVQPIDGGSISVAGIDVTADPVAAKRLCAYVPDNPDVYDFMTGLQYLAFIADIFEVPVRDRQARIEEYARRLELTDALASPIASYSHGMRQKLVVIGALIHEPRLLVLDEPFVGLDPLVSHELKRMLHELAARGGAVFFSSHVLEVVEEALQQGRHHPPRPDRRRGNHRRGARRRYARGGSSWNSSRTGAGTGAMGNLPPAARPSTATRRHPCAPSSSSCACRCMRSSARSRRDRAASAWRSPW